MFSCIRRMLGTFWRQFLAPHVTRSVAARLDHTIDEKIRAGVEAGLIDIRESVDSLVASKLAIVRDRKPWKDNLFIPRLDIHPTVASHFFAYSTCAAADFFHPDFGVLCGRLGIEPTYHRKFWEWVFILHHAERTGAIGPGRRALGFAVGTEPLPSAFAKLGTHVTATDAPEEIGVAQGWQKSGEHAGRLNDLYQSAIIDRALFDRQVTFRQCDMCNIPTDLTGYDFCWSACAFEHLGTLQKGLDFVIESLERTLKPGGIACHTTEFNLSSDTDTVEAGATVLYRKRDLLRLIDTLEGRGHSVEPLRIAPDNHVLDFFVDTPPYHAPPHLKLQLLGHVSTSVGLVIRRGP